MHQSVSLSNLFFFSAGGVLTQNKQSGTGYSQRASDISLTQTKALPTLHITSRTTADGFLSGGTVIQRRQTQLVVRATFILS